jgi:hypothetical protein
MSDSFKFQAKFPDILLRGILKDISITVSWINLRETEPDKFIKEKQLELVVFHALKQIDLKHIFIVPTDAHYYKIMEMLKQF